jgi:hypothetical protein
MATLITGHTTTIRIVITEIIMVTVAITVTMPTILAIVTMATGIDAREGLVAGETSNDDFAKLPTWLRDFGCPACRMRHRWLKADAWSPNLSLR